MTRAWATEFGPSGVRVNAVSPGVIVPPGTDAQEPGVPEIIDGIAAGRPGQADEIASATAFLATDAAKYVYGAVLPATEADSRVDRCGDVPEPSPRRRGLRHFTAHVITP